MKIKAVASRNGTKKRPEAWRVLLDGESDWRDVHPLVGSFIESVARWQGAADYLGYTFSPGEGPAKWLVYLVRAENSLGELLNTDPRTLPLELHWTGKARAAYVPMEAREEYASKIFRFA
jgi:hypothetical protein